MSIIAFDFETFLIDTHYPAPYGYQGAAPIPVCLSVATDKGAKLYAGPEMYKVTRKLFEGDHILVGQNVAFDLVLAYKHCSVPLERIFEKFDKGQIKCTQVRELLIKMESGEMIRNPSLKYSLAAMTERYLNKDVSHLKGEDAWRMRYSELIDVPLEDWPQEAIDYPIGDSVDTLEIYHAQRLRSDYDGMVSPDEANQTASSFDLRLISLNSPKVNHERTTEFVAKHKAQAEKLDDVLLEKDLHWWNENKSTKYPKGDERRAGYSVYTKKLQQYVKKDYERQGLEVPLTDKGRISTKSDVLAGCTNKLLQSYGELGADRKIMSSFAPKVMEQRGFQVSPSYNVLLTTGRTSCFGPNMQQSIKAVGFRECFEPNDPNKIFVAKDFDSFESFGLAQSLYEEFGERGWLDELNGPRDDHLVTGAFSFGLDYDELANDYFVKETDQAKNIRNLSKVIAFGGAGGLGSGTLTPMIGKDLRVMVQAKDPEAPITYLVQQLLDEWRALKGLTPLIQKAKRVTKNPMCKYEQPITGRVRRGFTYCQYLNARFQPRCADAAKRAISRCTRLMDEYNVALAVFVHDEVIFEIPKNNILECTEVMKDAMIQGAAEILPDCNLTMGVEVTGDRWKKKGISVEEYLKNEGLA